MDVAAAKDFLRNNNRAVMSTLRSDGQPQMSPVTVALDAEGRVIISSRETAMKVRNLSRRPRAWLVVLNDAFFGEWCQVEGDTEVLHLPEAMEGLVDYYRRAAGEHPDWDEYRQAMRDQRRVLIRMTIDRVGPTRSG